MDEGFWWKLYDFEFRRRIEINDNLRHTFQLSIAEIAFVIYYSGNLINNIIIYRSIAIYCIWTVMILATISVILCTIGYAFYKTAFPNPASELKSYRVQLEEFDADNAERLFSDFIHERWAENADKNAHRNRAKSALSFWSRILLAVSAIPLLASVICYLANRTLL